jgi:urease subunit beta
MSSKISVNESGAGMLGGIVVGKGDIEINAGRPVTTLKVRNTGDRPIQVGSHFHFFEVNRALQFDRAKAFGQRLNIPATTGVRFEPGEEHEVQLVPFGGKQCVYGFNNLVDNWAGGSAVYQPVKTGSIEKAAQLGFKSKITDKEKPESK